MQYPLNAEREMDSMVRRVEVERAKIAIGNALKEYREDILPKWRDAEFVAPKWKTTSAVPRTHHWK